MLGEKKSAVTTYKREILKQEYKMGPGQIIASCPD
jgi:hypothetical protein